MDEDILAGVAEDWQVVLRVLPSGWQEKARELGALRRYREFPDAGTLLRVLLIHLAEGCSLRETAVRAAEGRLVTVSDVALLKRLRVSGEWFRWMGEELMRHWMTARPVLPLLGAGWRVRIVDGSTVSEPGATGSTWRLHYAVGLPALACEEVHVTATSVGESLCRFQVAAGDLLIADRGFATRNGVRHVHQHGGAVIVRLNLTNLPLSDREGQPFALLPQLRTLNGDQIGDWPVAVSEDKNGSQPITGRVCAIKKSQTAAERARAKAERESRRGGHQVQPETLEAAEYIFVFTTLAADIPAPAILEMYRGRWQVELAFKRLKSLLALGHLKKVDPQGAKAWLQGKLLVAILIETLIALAERFFPWGYPLVPDSSSLPLAGNLTHAAPS
ncbi:MAG: IS4 family transposase [Alphaproteobacteria bacterium]|nr:IS4 family transposase [Alphaproteobacteria bacterium]